MSPASPQNINSSVKHSNSFMFAAIITSLFVIIFNSEANNCEAKEAESVNVESSIDSDLRKLINEYKTLPHWKLANRISHSELPKQCIESLLIEIFQEIEESKQIKLSQHTRKKISNSLPKENIEDLEDLLMLNICVRIFGWYSNEQIEEMLEEHEKYQIINNEKYKHWIQTDYAISYDAIVQDVVEHAMTMSPLLVRQVFDIAQKEGFTWAHAHNQLKEKNEL